MAWKLATEGMGNLYITVVIKQGQIKLRIKNMKEKKAIIPNNMFQCFYFIFSPGLGIRDCGEMRKGGNLP